MFKFKIYNILRRIQKHELTSREKKIENYYILIYVHRIGLIGVGHSNIIAKSVNFTHILIV